MRYEGLGSTVFLEGMVCGSDDTEDDGKVGWGGRFRGGLGVLNRCLVKLLQACGVNGCW